jgi:hypothetical protein
MSPIGEFNKEYFEFLNFIKDHIDDPKFKTFYRKNQIIKQTNPKMFIKTWYDRIGSKYHAQVMQSDISFFLNKNYEEDVTIAGNDSNTLLIYINKFKESYETLDENIKAKFMYYIITLTDKSFVYYKQIQNVFGMKMVKE